MLKRVVTYGTLIPLLLLLLIWAHGHTERMERSTDRTVCEIRHKC